MENHTPLVVAVSRVENKTYLPGDVIAGSPYVGRCSVNPSDVVMRCGNFGGTCDVRFTLDKNRLLLAVKKGANVYCPDCTDPIVKEELRERQHQNTMTPRGKKTAKQVMLEVYIRLGGPKLRDEFTYPDVVLAAWRAAPATFGLPGHEDKFPDSNRVKMELCNWRDGGVMDLYLERPRANVYRFSDAGRKRLQRENRRAEHERKAQTGDGV